MMRVFVTGATGFIGSAVVRELLEAGHQVVGLARTDATAAALKETGADVHRGQLDDLDSLRSGAATADGVIHLAFKHDFSDFDGAVALDLRAVKVMGTALEDSGKPFVITSGTMMLTLILPQGRIGTEEDTTAAGQTAMGRLAAENAAIALAKRGVRSSFVRLAPSVHGYGDHGLVPRLIQIAREKGVSAYVGDGLNRWPAVHRLDAARLFRLALESAPAGSRLHGVGDEGVQFRDIASVIGRHLNVLAVSIRREEAESHFGWIGAFASTDNPTSSALPQQRLGWRPVRPALIPDLEEGHYFNH